MWILLNQLWEIPVVVDDVDPPEPDVESPCQKTAQAAEHLKVQPPVK